MPESSARVVSDYICPFCYLEKTQLERAATEEGITLEWVNIEIHPETPLEGLPDKYLNSPYYRSAWAQVENLCKDFGVEIRKPRVGANSHLALLTSEFARKFGKFSEVHDAIFTAYWLEDENIGELNVLHDIVLEAGLDKAQLRKFLEDGEGEDSLKANERFAQEQAVYAVPTLIYGGKKYSGARPYMAVKKILADAQGPGTDLVTL